MVFEPLQELWRLPKARFSQNWFSTAWTGKTSGRNSGLCTCSEPWMLFEIARGWFLSCFFGFCVLPECLLRGEDVAQTHSSTEFQTLKKSHDCPEIQPRPSKGCFLKAFKYFKTPNKHPNRRVLEGKSYFVFFGISPFSPRPQAVFLAEKVFPAHRTKPFGGGTPSAWPTSAASMRITWTWTGIAYCCLGCCFVFLWFWFWFWVLDFGFGFGFWFGFWFALVLFCFVLFGFGFGLGWLVGWLGFDVGLVWFVSWIDVSLVWFC